MNIITKMILLTVIFYISFYMYKGTGESSVLGATAYVFAQIIVTIIIPAIIGIFIIRNEKKGKAALLLKIIFWFIWLIVPVCMILGAIKDKLGGSLY